MRNLLRKSFGKTKSIESDPIDLVGNGISQKQNHEIEVENIFKKYPEKFSPAIQEKILAGQIVLGMSPYEAYLAAGAFAFKVITNPKKWEANADPYNVMWAQSTHPDDSKIWMTFNNDTQYPTEEKRSFRVFFRNGKAVEIEKLGRLK